MGSVPVAVAAKIYGKDCAWVRAGIIAGWLPIGTATRAGRVVTNVSEIDSRKGRINYYISPIRLYQHTGYVYDDTVQKYLSYDGLVKPSKGSIALKTDISDPTFEAVCGRLENE